MRFFSTNTLSRSPQVSSINPSSVDLELGNLSFGQRSRPLDLKTLSKTPSVLTKLYETPTHALDGAMTIATKAKRRIPKRWLAPGILLIAPAISGALIGTLALVMPARSDSYVACRASVCAGFAAPKYAILGEVEKTRGYTGGNLQEVCLSHFVDGFYDAADSQFVNFDQVLVRGDNQTWTVSEPCGYLNAEKIKSEHNKTMQGQVSRGALASAAVINALIIGKWIFNRLSRPMDHWLDDNLRAILSPRLYALTTNISNMSESEQNELSEELKPILQDLLAQSVERGDPMTLQALLDLGISPTDSTDKRKSALEVSLSRQNSELTPKLIERATSLTSRHITAAARAADLTSMMDIITNIEVSQNLTQNEMQALYHMLPENLLAELCATHDVSRGDLSQVLAKMGNAAQRFVHARGGLGRTPLHVASFWQHSDLMKSLIQFGADDTVTDVFGKTPADLFQIGQQQPIYVVD